MNPLTEQQKIEADRFSREIIKMFLMNSGVTDPDELAESVARVSKNLLDLERPEGLDTDSSPCSEGRGDLIDPKSTD